MSVDSGAGGAAWASRLTPFFMPSRVPDQRVIEFG
jgi:hypothetical protein